MAVGAEAGMAVGDGDGDGAVPAGIGVGVAVGVGAGVVGVSVSDGDGEVGAGAVGVGASAGARSGLGRRITTIPGSIRTALRQTWFTRTRPRMTRVSELCGNGLEHDVVDQSSRSHVSGDRN